MTNLLSVNNLSVSFTTGSTVQKVVSEVSFDVKKGETIGLVGESGSGKSVTARSIMKLLAQNAHIHPESSIVYMGNELLTKSEKEMQQIRGNDIGMIFQDPMTSLNPTMTMGKQITESLLFHEKLSAKEAEKRAKEIMTNVGINNVDYRYTQYAHEFSGGMRQRMMIAMSLACNPSLIIADEPTTALDVTIQAQILQLLKDLQKQYGMAIILITHDFGVVANMCDKVVVMKDGKVVETGATTAVFENPQNDYTKMLLAAIPNLHQEKTMKQREKLAEIHAGKREPILQITQLTKAFPYGRNQQVTAVDHLDFTIFRGKW